MFNTSTPASSSQMMTPRVRFIKNKLNEVKKDIGFGGTVLNSNNKLKRSPFISKVNSVSHKVPPAPFAAGNIDLWSTPTNKLFKCNTDKKIGINAQPQHDEN